MRNTQKKKIRPKIGDVFQIKLPNGKYAYGRVYKDASVGIYREVSSEPNHPPIGSRDFLFNVGMYKDILSTGEFPIVGYDPFKEDESAWPDPKCIIDSISGEFSLYFEGKITPSSAKECKGLEEAAVWDSHHIISRIMNTNQP